MKNYNIDNPESRPQDQKRLQQLWTDQQAILDQGELLYLDQQKKLEKFIRFISKQNYALDQQKHGGGGSCYSTMLQKRQWTNMKNKITLVKKEQ